MSNVGGITRIKKDNQALIENVLDMWLTTSQLAWIKEEWNAFYNDPLKYKGTIVIDMVKQDVLDCLAQLEDIII